MRFLREFQISIRAGLGIGIVAAVVLTAAIVHVPWSLTSRANIADLNTRLNAQVIRAIGEKIDGLLENAVAARRAIATNLTESVIDIDDQVKREFLFLSFLQSQPSLTSIEFGWADDRSFLVRRGADGMVRMEETIPGAPSPSRRSDIYQVSDDGELMFVKRENEPSDYHVTQQFWYFTAFDREAPVWTNIYPLPASGTLGVTTTRPVIRNGELLGALGVSIALDRLSEFLNGLEISANGAVFLTNVSDELVATQRRSGEPPGRGELVKLEDSAFAPAQVVTAALKQSGVTLDSVDRTRQFTHRDPATADTSFVTVAPLSQMGLIVSVVIPEADLLGDINRNTRLLLLVLGGFIVAIAAVSWVLARKTVGAPLARVTENLRQLEDFRLDRITTVASRLSEIRSVSAATARMSASLASFKKYIPTELVRTLFARGIEAELGGERRELTILFMDLANFTSVSERLGDRVIEFLGEYLSEMSAVIQSGQGTIDKYIGDAIMAFWGAPIPADDHALAGCRAALACQARLAEIRRANQGRDDPELRARIGLNTGTVLVGHVGSRDRLNYTVIGDSVNVASRLEALNKLYGTEIIIGQQTRERAGAAIVVRPLDRVAVYGKEKGIEIYELLAMKSEAGAEMMEWIAAYRHGLELLRARDWDRAIEQFSLVIRMRGGMDSVSSLQIARARAFKLSPPAADWDGLMVMETK